jgi:hypothetical protein
MTMPFKDGTLCLLCKMYNEVLILGNDNIPWNSIVQFKYNAIATGAAINMQVYINATVEANVLYHDDHVIRGVLLC